MKKLFISLILLIGVYLNYASAADVYTVIDTVEGKKLVLQTVADPNNSIISLGNLTDTYVTIDVDGTAKLGMLTYNVNTGTFLGLLDTPSEYNGFAGQSVIVNGSADGLTFGTGAAASKIASWSILENYSANDMVNYSGIIYKSKTTNLGSQPNTNPTDWAIHTNYPENLSTGLKSGGSLSVNGGDNTLLDISLGEGKVVDTTTTPGSPSVAPVIWTAKTGYNLTTVASPGDVVAIFISLDSGGNVIERLSLANAEQRRDTIDLGIAIRNDSNQIVFVINTPLNFIHNPGSSMQDFFESWGGFPINDVEFSAFSNNLTLAVTDRNIFRNGVNARTNGKDPNRSMIPTTGSAIPFGYKLSDGTDVALGVTNIDPDNYDDGSSTPAAVPTGKFTIQQISYFPEGAVEILYGQQIFNSMSDAVTALPAVKFTIPSDSAGAIIGAFIILQEGATDLSEPTDVRFFQVDKKGNLKGIGYQNLNSAGMVDTPIITDNLNSTIDVSAAILNLYSTNDFKEDLFQFTVPLLDDQAIAEGLSFLTAVYNSGAPVYSIVTDESLINNSDRIRVADIYREIGGTTLHITPLNSAGSGLLDKLHQKDLEISKYDVVPGGIALGEIGTRNMTVTAGAVWLGGTRIDLDSVNSATDDTEFWYNVSSVWTKSTPTQYNNTQYDDGTDLQTLGVGRYAVNWIYRGAESDGHIFFVLGSDNHTLAAAQASSPPISLPDIIVNHSLLIGRIIVVNGGGTATQIDSSFTEQFDTSPITDHNTLSNLETGDVHTQYAYLNGRSGGQTLIAGSDASDNLILQSTSNATRGTVFINDNVVINEDGADVSLRVESDTNVNALIVDGTTGYVGLGIPTPEGTFHTASAGGTAHNHTYFDTYENTTNRFSNLHFRKSHSDVLGTKAETIDGDVLGVIDFLGVNGSSDFDHGVIIQAIQNGAAGATGVPVDLRIDTYSADGGFTANQLYLHNSGNTGFGTDTPEHKIQIANTFGARSDGIVYWGNDVRAASRANAGFLGWDTDLVHIGGSDAGTAVALYTAGTEKVRLDTTGRLGIQTTSPDGVLDCTPDTIDTGSYSYPFPRVTTAQRGSLTGMTEGAHVVDMDLDAVYVYDGASWVAAYTF